MKRLFLKIFRFALACICLAAGAAFAADPVVIDVLSTEPSELSGDGEVTVSFEISNHSTDDLTSLSISLDENVFEFPESVAIPASGSAILPIKLPLTLSQLDQPLVFTVSWVAGGEPFYGTAETKVSRSVDPTISLTREVSVKHARSGQLVTVTYTLKNSSKFDMTEVTLIDEQISDDAIRKNDVVRANGSFSIEYTFEMGTSDVVSQPVVTYMVNDKTKSFSNIKPVTVVYSNISVDISAEKQETDMNGTAFTVTVSNTGESDVFDVCVLDSDGATINTEPVDIKAGEEKTFTYNAAPLTSNQPKQISFTFTGTDSFGDALEQKSTRTFLINPYFDDSQFSVYLTVEVLTSPTEENQSAEIKFSLENKSLVPITDIRISEATLGEIIYTDTLPAGTTDMIQWVSCGTDADLEFFVDGRDSSGVNHQLASAPLSKEFLMPAISTDEPGTTETVDDPVLDAQKKTTLWGNFVFRVLIIIGSIMVISCAVLIALKVLDSGRRPVKEKDENIDEFFDDTEDKYMGDDLYNDNRYGDEDYAVPGDESPESETSPSHIRSFFADSDDSAPKHLVLKKQPAKKKKSKSTVRRID